MLSRLQLKLFGHQFDVVQFRGKIAIRITSFATQNSIATRGVDIWFFPLGSIPLTHCCHNIVDTPFTNTALDFSRKISKEKNDVLIDLQTSDKNTHQYIFF